jgi:hypothetical protein
MSSRESDGGSIRQVCAGLFVLATILATAVPAQAATFTVNTTLDLPDTNLADNACDADPSPLEVLCTLRAAIMEANDEPGPDTIGFNIPALDPGCTGQQWCTITLTMLDLPPLVDDGTYINGLTQPNTNPGFVGSGTGTTPEIPGYDVNNPCVALAAGMTVLGLTPTPAPLVFPKPDIAINANNAVNAMSIAGTASDITIRGLAVYNSLEHAILGDSGLGTDRLIDLMFIGALPQDDDPTTMLVNEQDPLALRNKETGVRQLSPGFLDVTRSYVGFNGQGGLDGFSSASVVNFVLNETFENGLFSDSHDGMDVNGINSTARCNLSHNNRTIGDVPNGGGGAGIELGSKSSSGEALDNNLVEYNTVRNNVSSGISLRKGPRGNVAVRNVVADNHVGISVNTEGRIPTNRNELTKNSTFSNMTLGIDLQLVQNIVTDPITGEEVDVLPWVGSPDLITPNDHCDPDGGPAPDGSGENTASNDLQNFPDLTGAFAFNGQTQIQGSLDSTPFRRYRIEFFKTPGGMLFGPLDREGMFFIGQTFVETGMDCLGHFNVNFATTVPDGDVITATATRDELNDPTPWSTSEYSAPMDVNLFVPEGKVTGGGWFFQPQNGVPTPPSSDRRANFGFNAQYHKDNPQPKGHTTFVFRSNNSNMHLNSLEYEIASLQVMQNPDGTGWARWRGTAKLNNDPNYCFRTYVEDNNEPGVEDEWHIKIWHKGTSGGSCSNDGAPVYDNFPANGPHGPGQGTVINGGNIQLHPPNP